MSWNGFRNGLQKVHLWVGLILSIPFILIGVSGSLIVVFSELPKMSLPAATARGDVKPMERILAAAVATAPEGWRAQAIVMPQSVGDPATVQLALPRGQRPPRGAGQNFVAGTRYVDPVSLSVLTGTEIPRNGPIMRTMTTLHIALMFPGHYGLQTVGFMGVAMVLFGVSGLVLWWPKTGQWRFAFGVKRGTRGFRLNRDLHGAVGFWSLAVFLILSVSGVYLAFPVTVQQAVAAVLPLENEILDGHVDPATAAGIANPNALTADDAAKLALSAVANAGILSVQLPPDAGGIFMVTLMPRPFGDGAPTISAFVGPGTEVSSIVDPRTYSFGKRILVWLRVLHYGLGLGMVWKVVVFFAGFLPLLFAITGLRMWQLKRSRRQTLPEGLAAPAE